MSRRTLPHPQKPLLNALSKPEMTGAHNYEKLLEVDSQFKGDEHEQL